MFHLKIIKACVFALVTNFVRRYPTNALTLQINLNLVLNTAVVLIIHYLS